MTFCRNRPSHPDQNCNLKFRFTQNVALLSCLFASLHAALCFSSTNSSLIFFSIPRFVRKTRQCGLNTFSWEFLESVLLRCPLWGIFERDIISTLPWDTFDEIWHRYLFCSMRSPLHLLQLTICNDSFPQNYPPKLKTIIENGIVSLNLEGT